MNQHQPTFDAGKYKETTRQQWNATAQAWHSWGPLLSKWLGPATETMLDIADITTGSRVLDIAAGAGEQSVTAARRVSPTGHVLATDFSPDILKYANRAAKVAGFDNIYTREMDGED